MRAKLLSTILLASVLTTGLVVIHAADSDTGAPGTRSSSAYRLTLPKLDLGPRSVTGSTPAADDCGPYFTWEGTRDSMMLGHQISPLGDVNNDGWDDLWISEGGWHLAARAYVYSGADRSLLFTVEAEAASGFFMNAITADLDGDDYPELIFGDLSYDGVVRQAGRLYAMTGMPGPYPAIRLAADATVIADGDSAAAFGIVTALGDIDGDTYDDFAVGASYWGSLHPGSVWVYSGANFDTLYALGGSESAQAFGMFMATAGDVNGDGQLDFLVGAPGDTTPGYVSAYTAATGELIYLLYGETAGDRFSYYGVDGTGDLNQDGYDDVIVGAYNNAAGGDYAGRAYVFFGGPGPFPDTIHAADADYVMTGGYGGFMGFDAGGIGDINADGFPDFMVGSTYWSWNPKGHVFLAAGQTGSQLFDIEGLLGLEDFGFSCAAPWDIDGDGTRDLVVGAFDETEYLLDAGPARGRVYGYLIGDRDQDTVMAQCDNCQRYWTPWNRSFVTGDCNDDLSITSADIIHLVGYVFKGGAPPEPIPEVGDVDFNQTVNSADIIYLVTHVFKGGAVPLDACAW